MESRLVGEAGDRHHQCWSVGGQAAWGSRYQPPALDRCGSRVGFSGYFFFRLARAARLASVRRDGPAPGRLTPLGFNLADTV